ncbi:MAG: class IV adenylate cyclase [Anaerolineae bacterium]|nr:class IV adenylate cyclase [Anaerolineae bacterium]
MATNIEIKAKVQDFDRLKKRVEKLSDTPVEIIPQQDTFFHTPKGRLKLRQLTPNRGQLIYYEREDIAGPKQSNYFIYPTPAPQTLAAILAAAWGVRGVVCKERLLYMVGSTRIHLDKVEGLGDFLEFEVVLNETDTPAAGEAIASVLMAKLGIAESDLVEGAYIDLLGDTQED